MLTDFEKFHPTQIKNPPYMFIDFLDFSTLHVYSNLHVYWFCNFCTPSMFIPTSTAIREMRVYSSFLKALQQTKDKMFTLLELNVNLFTENQDSCTKVLGVLDQKIKH